MMRFRYERIDHGRLRENLESLKLKNTLEILDNYLERAVKDDLNIVEVLDHILEEEAKSKRKRAYEKQVQMSGFPIKKTHFENRLPDKLKVLGKYRLLIIEYYCV